MLDTFWNSLELEDISDLNYVSPDPYPIESKKEAVIEKLDWVILRLYKMKDHRKYDYDIVVGLKTKIQHGNCSLTHKGIEFLNLIASDLKDPSSI